MSNAQYSRQQSSRLHPAIGQRFTRLVVLARGENSPAGKARWVCQCDCGNHSLVDTNSLKSGNSKSCGCLQKEVVTLSNDAQRSALVGQRFARLMVLERAPNTPGGKTRWRCYCDCGKECVVDAEKLKSGNTRSCGCLHQEVRGLQNRSHGLSKAPEYAVYIAMRMRCTNPKDANYAYYGGRGIQCLWASFAEFYADMGPRPSPEFTIERCDNNGNYCKENCTWATRAAQSLNTRSTRLVSYYGELLPISHVAKLSHRSWQWLNKRLLAGLSIEEAAWVGEL